ncbi:MAG: ABC transporter ATP-binding protein [Chloroflexota bacterium]
MMLPIIVKDVSKKFRRYHPERPTTLLETFIHGLNRLKPTEQFWALRDVTFSVPAGRLTGIIGANGAGKSTLLSLLGGIGQPDSGLVQTKGRIGALLQLGSGFHPDLTGRENVIISGVISGLTRREVAARFDEIVAFSELETFIDSPLRTYSTGMQMRLAFAVAVHIEPDILLIDEVLAVGDIAFQRKCLDRITQFKTNGCAIVFVSHDLGVVQQLCDEVIWLKGGFIVGQGPSEIVVRQYQEQMTTETRRRTPSSDPTLHTAVNPALKINENRFGSLEMEITSVNLLAAGGESVDELPSGQPLSVEIAYRASQPISSPIFGVTISREDGFVCYDTNTSAAGVVTPLLTNSGSITLVFDRLDLTANTYYLDVGVYERTWAYAYDYHWHVYPLRITALGTDKGIVRPPHRWIWSSYERRD